LLELDDEVLAAAVALVADLVGAPVVAGDVVPPVAVPGAEVEVSRLEVTVSDAEAVVVPLVVEFANGQFLSSIGV
jgi:hypothetical protein